MIRTHLALLVVAPILVSMNAEAAPPPPSSVAHPRIWLTTPTLAALKTNAQNQNSEATKVVAKCLDVQENPDQYKSTTDDSWTWGFAASSCALAWVLTGNGSYASTAITYWNALLDDYNTIGDGQGGDGVVQHDSGYDIRVYTPYAALAYDWLHDAPGVDATLLSNSRERFKAWIDWYTAQGYLNDTAGSNYHAGYAFAKALVAVAEAGEDGTTSDGYWSDVVDTVFTNEVVGKGLASGGAIAGGDWPEGWQYGPLSVLEYALAGRALVEQGAQLPGLSDWASSVGVNFFYTVPPAQDGVFTDGDVDQDGPLALLTPRPLLAAGVIGSDQAAAWAQSFIAANPTSLDEEWPVPAALIEARGVAPADFLSTTPSLFYVTSGTRKIYARSSWQKDAMWATFTSAPRLVPDHQHPDASNFVLSRGADPLIVDPSPYGSLSTLTSNAFTVDSNVIDPQAKPGQAIWENASDMPWARAGASGIAVARATLSGAFDGTNGTASDVPFALRGWAFLPEGEVVVLDRARTDDASRGLHLRFRTPATLQLSGTLATGTSGGSEVAIHAVGLPSGVTPKIHTYPDGGSCDNSPTWGVCNAARFAVNELAIDVPGPSSLAVHVIDALGPGESPSTAVPLSDASVDTNPPGNGAVIGAAVRRGGVVTYVVASSAKDGAAGGSLAYGVPGDATARHVVFDAPADASGASTVTAAASGGRCQITVTPGGSSAFAGKPLLFAVSAASAGCVATEDKPAGAEGVPNGGGVPGATPGGGTSSGAGGSASGGCGCRAAGAESQAGVLALAVAAGLLARRRRVRP